MISGAGTLWELDMTQAKEGKAVKIHYTGRLKDGTVFDSSSGRPPLQFSTQFPAALLNEPDEVCAGVAVFIQTLLQCPAPLRDIGPVVYRIALLQRLTDPCVLVVR